ncbi:hypothetical protein NC796_16805 [Aliifodinibius sp. S!AR15-10]|uniref:hypothetical protein n=1 Tax=Aliifodinibius sp. S!AR15-10 TaxID=2950437 RepID=UPI00285A5E80|nr:hypothetical protein [Aliifodinibius sp. S!AR15-10]MDR8392818.1 hypothetical protein [Aliifodinibius sp. S!AR15-10]
MKITITLSLLFSLSLPIHAQSTGLHAKDTAELHSPGEPGDQYEQIVEKIRAATEIYKDQKKAQAAGYRKFGPDMPNMGVHWINPALAVNRIFDWATPSTLTYLEVNGEPRLTGVAYTFPVQPGEVPPGLPLKGIEWHFHSGDLEKEAHGLHDHEIHPPYTEKARLAMIHAWVWAGNPQGYFVADNWALSYLRLGITPPADPDPGASKVLFLLDDGTDYFLRFMELASERKLPNNDKIQNILHRYREKVKVLATRMQEQLEVTEGDQHELKRLWGGMWKEMELVVGEDIWPLIKKHLDHQMVFSR